jgi:hypothetical protein
MKILALASLLFVACSAVPPPPQTSSSSSAGVLFGTERISPDTVRLTLDNGASQPIGYNLCSSDLQRRSGSDWVRVDTGEMCTMQLLTLNPGHDATFEKKLPAGLSAGDYRYVTSVENPLGTAPARIATAPFTR